MACEPRKLGEGHRADSSTWLERTQLDLSLLDSRIRRQWLSLCKPLELGHSVMAAPENKYRELVGKIERKKKNQPSSF